MSLATGDTLQVLLERDLMAPEQARHAVGAMCEDLHPDVSPVAQLLGSELVTNALQHGRGRIDVRINRSPGQLFVSVEDESDAEPVVRSGDIDDEGGRGLLIVEMLASTWGVLRRGRGGKTVWFTLRLVPDLDALARGSGAALPGSEPGHGIHGGAVPEHHEVQVAPGRVAGGPDVADDLSALHPVPDVGGEAAEVVVGGAQTAA